VRGSKIVNRIIVMQNHEMATVVGQERETMVSAKIFTLP